MGHINSTVLPLTHLKYLVQPVSGTIVNSLFESQPLWFIVDFVVSLLDCDGVHGVFSGEVHNFEVGSKLYPIWHTNIANSLLIHL